MNQDTNWDVPGSPEPGAKGEPNSTAGPPPWKPSPNNGAFLGTDLWEANLRNGGQPTAPPVSKTPWGHTPTTNIGGTWGEDDDAADSGNVWNGPPPPQQWSGGGGGGAPPPHSQQWTAPKKDDWNAWGEPRCADPRLEHGRADPRAPPPDPRIDLRGGISGRLNGGDMWTQHHQHTAPPNKMMPPNSGGGNQWNSQVNVSTTSSCMIHKHIEPHNISNDDYRVTGSQGFDEGFGMGRTIPAGDATRDRRLR